MIVKQTDTMHMLEPERCVQGVGFESIRFILAKDNMGFSLHKTIIKPNEIYHWHYTNHLEACFCIKGKGEITDLATGKKYTITEGSIYILNNHDDHTFEAFEEVELISVFNPPCTGNEVHRADGSYEIKNY